MIFQNERYISAFAKSMGVGLVVVVFSERHLDTNLDSIDRVLPINGIALMKVNAYGLNSFMSSDVSDIPLDKWNIIVFSLVGK